MSGKGKPKKARIDIAKPELPPFLQRMKEQIVANEASDRSKQSENRRSRPRRPSDPEDEPTIIKIGDDDLTEAEYKRMKTELETQYKLTAESARDPKQANHELDIDLIIGTRQGSSISTKSTSREDRSRPSRAQAQGEGPSSSRTGAPIPKTANTSRKVLSYDSSSEEE